MILKVRQIYDWKELEKLATDPHILYDTMNIPTQLCETKNGNRVSIRVADRDVMDSDLPLLILVFTDKTWNKCMGHDKNET